MSLLLFPPFLCLLLLCIGPASVLSADDAILRRLSIQNRWLRRRDHIWFGGSAHKELGQQSCDDREPDQYFAQKLDHTNANGTDTYDQRYQANLRHHNSSSPWPIVFLMIGGEGQIHDKWVCDQRVTIMQLAARHGAIVVQLEHRFFGRNDSSGLGDLSAENLQRLLSLDQALDDIATFVPFFNARYGLLNARWVAFGGSYPGSMAAWLRVKYPDLTAGSVASSAPIWPKVDFWEYSATMENAIKETSAQCLAKVKSAFSELASRIHDDQGKESLTMLYSAKPELKDLSPIDLTNFLSAVFGTWQGIIQYTFDEPYHVLDNVTRACELLDEAADLQQGLYNVFWMVKWQQCQRAGIPEEECRVNDFRYSKAIEPFLNTSLESDEAAGRAWMWMTCNEFGWYQTTDKENSIFGDIISLNFYYQQCADIFGSQIGARFVESRVEKSLTKWGDGCTFEASNIILPNGRFDPWSALGIRGICRGPAKQKADLARHLVAAWTPAAAHCADMYPAYEGEPAGLELTRQKVAAEVKYYLDSALDRLQNGAIGRVGGGMAIVMLLVSFLSLFNFMAILL